MTSSHKTYTYGILLVIIFVCKDNDAISGNIQKVSSAVWTHPVHSIFEFILATF